MNSTTEMERFVTTILAPSRRWLSERLSDESSRPTDNGTFSIQDQNSSPSMLRISVGENERHYQCAKAEDGTLRNVIQSRTESLDWTHHSFANLRWNQSMHGGSFASPVSILSPTVTMSPFKSKATLKSKMAPPFYPPLDEILLDSPGSYGTTKGQFSTNIFDSSEHHCSFQRISSIPVPVSLIDDESEHARSHSINIKTPYHDMLVGKLQNFYRSNIEVSPGIEADLIGAQETLEALASGRMVSCACMICDVWLSCMDGATMVLCPSCYTISPIHDSNSDDLFLTVGLGLLADK
ncbi:hypothetical protein MPSEU_000592200 [Mayamaea pseudoterrestris]|nr:hypothetical protein MPSEU_000592200 [Mayamaea pseudoterrestris]